MESKYEQQDSYPQPENRRSRGTYQHNSYRDHPYPNPGPEADEWQARHPGWQQQGRGQDLHASHPYDYSLPPETNRRLSTGYYPTPAHHGRQYRPGTGQDYAEDRSSYPDQHRRPGERQASEQERQDYIRARDQYSPPRGGYQQPYRPEDRRHYQPDYRSYPDRERGRQQWEDRFQNRNQPWNWPENRQQNRNPTPPPRVFSDEPGGEMRPRPGAGRPPFRARTNESNTGENYLHYPDFQGGDW